MPEDVTEDDYRHAFEVLITAFEAMVGTKVARSVARRAPIEMTADGNVEDYYGSGEQALNILVNQYEDTVGADVAAIRVGTVLDDVHDTIAETLKERLEDNDETNTDGIIGYLRSLITVPA